MFAHLLVCMVICLLGVHLPFLWRCRKREPSALCVLARVAMPGFWGLSRTCRPPHHCGWAERTWQWAHHVVVNFRRCPRWYFWAWEPKELASLSFGPRARKLGWEGPSGGFGERAGADAPPACACNRISRARCPGGFRRGRLCLGLADQHSENGPVVDLQPNFFFQKMVFWGV
jgi:hypothetical protein